MTQLSKEEKVAIATTKFGNGYRNDVGEIYFTVYGDRNRKYTLDEALYWTMENPSNPKFVNLSKVVDEFNDESFLVKFAPKKKFILTRGEGWHDEFVSSDRRDVDDYFREKLKYHWQKVPGVFTIIEMDLENPFIQ